MMIHLLYERDIYTYNKRSVDHKTKCCDQKYKKREKKAKAKQDCS